MIGLTFDTGALIALESRRQRMREVLERALARDQPITVPADVLAEWWRGRNDLRELILQSLEVEPLTESLAKLAGEAVAAVRGATSVDRSASSWLPLPRAWLLGPTRVTSPILDKLRAYFPNVSLAEGLSSLTVPKIAGIVRGGARAWAGVTPGDFRRSLS